MADNSSMKSGDLSLQVINGEDVIPNQKDRFDGRYDRPMARVIPAEKISSYETKRWPTLSEGDEDLTNALGYPLGSWFEKKQEEERRKQEQQAKEQQAQAEAQKQAEAEQQQALTVENLEQIQTQAYEEGHQEGFEKGQAEGFAQGLEKGTQEGQEQGYAEGQKKGYDDGFLQGREEGFKQGHAEGLQGGESIVLEQVERFRHLADALANPLREVDRDVTDEIVYIISRLSKVIIGRELKADHNYLVASIQKALTVLPNADKGAVVSLNPDDLGVLEATIGREYMSAQHWEMVGDESLEPGDIKVSNEASTVEWRLHDRIDALLDEFLSAAAPAVDSALREEIPDAPAHDAVPKAQLSPKPKLQAAMQSSAAAPQAQEQTETVAAPQQAAPAAPAAPVKAMPKPAAAPAPKPAAAPAPKPATPKAAAPKPAAQAQAAQSAPAKAAPKPAAPGAAQGG
ncbi:MAG: flagellar assembly protein FliH [Succinivibrio sp.]|nr:flagellar assembly protein FliH [Succinivibrio sp.]